MMIISQYPDYPDTTGHKNVTFHAQETNENGMYRCFLCYNGVRTGHETICTLHRITRVEKELRQLYKQDKRR